MKSLLQKCRAGVIMVVALCLATTIAQAQVTLSGEIRPRTEYRHGFKKLATDDMSPALFTEQRSRIVLGYTGDQYKVKISLQDVRIWGGVSQIYKTDASLMNIHEAWGEYFINDSWTVKLGRQELNYDNARILGNLAWAQQSRSHDLIKLTYKGDLGEVHAGAAFNQDALTPEFRKLVGNYYSGVNNYKTMQYLWYHKGFDKGKFSILFLNNGVQVGPDSASSVNFTQTIGGIGDIKAGGVTLGGEFYYQTGTDGAGLEVGALLASVTAGFKVGPAAITVGGDYLSGTESGSGVNGAFTPYYGTNHKFYGLMDYFYVGNAHGNVGLLNGFAKAKFKTGEKSALISQLHYFSSAVDVMSPTDGTTVLSSSLGTELDLVYNVNISPELNLKLGYSQLFGTETMQAIKGGSLDAINNWAWAMFTFKPKFIQ